MPAVNIDERYCVFPRPGQFGIFVRFDPKEEGENDPHFRLIAVKRWKDKIVLNKSPLAKSTIESINKTGKLNRQLRFDARIAPELIQKMAELVAENMGSTEIQNDPFVKRVEEKKAEKTMEDDLDIYSEFK
jgi:hypothetical protein